MSESTTSTEPAKVVSRSARFFQECIVFEVEGTLYRVPKHGFEKYSHSFFRDLFSLPQGSKEGREGESEGNPIRPPQVTRDEFDSLLEVIYPLQLRGPPSLSKEQWVGVLRLSRQWDMPDVAALAIEKLAALDLTSIEKVKLGKAHGVPQWLKDGYTALVGDVDSASLEELLSLGAETAVRILYTQTQARGVKEKETQVYCGYCLKTFKANHPVLYEDTGLYAGTDRCTNPNCKYDPRTSGYGAYTQVNFSETKPSASPSVAEKVSEVFRDEIEDAERRSTLPIA